MKNHSNIYKINISKDEPVILYGAGNYGQFICNFLETKCNMRISAFCDSDVSLYEREILNKKVLPLHAVQNKFEKFSLIISIFNKNSVKEVKKICLNAGIPKEFIFDNISGNPDILREYCAIKHIDNPEFFDTAEDSNAVNIFWGEDSEFLKLFKQIDLTSVVELACGRGRHLPFYISRAQKVVLVDILEKNINICKDRFAEYNNIVYYKNNGFDFNELESDKYTAVFSYDSMVHFESLDIYAYLLETYRILQKGGKALFHHSNNFSDYKADFTNAVNSRSYMSANLFKHFAYKAGFKIEDQKIIDWNGEKDLDAITLLIKD